MIWTAFITVSFLSIEADSKIATQYPYQDQIADTWIWENTANGHPVNTVTLRNRGIECPSFYSKAEIFSFNASRTISHSLIRIPRVNIRNSSVSHRVQCKVR